MNLVYRRRVGYELNNICQWYERQRQGLDEEFIEEFDTLIKAIIEFPQAFMRVDDKVRRASMKRFPYNVFYQIESKRIVVLAVIHSARHPNEWPHFQRKSH